MELQHINVKLLVAPIDTLDLGSVIPVFHRWIQERASEELLLDVTDYRHVRAGPGVILIGHEANYSLDNHGNRLGVRYNRKAQVDGSNQDRLRLATLAALHACLRLQKDLNVEGDPLFNGQEIEIFTNDRALAPNDADTRGVFLSELDPFLGKFFAGESYSLDFRPDPRSLLGATVKTLRPFAVEELLNNLRSLPAHKLPGVFPVGRLP